MVVVRSWSVGDPGLADGVEPGIEVRVARPGSRLAEALAGTDGLVLREALAADGLRGLIVQRVDGGDGKTVADRLGRYEHVDGLRGEFLDPVAAVYVLDDLAQLPPPLDEVVGHVARRLLAGDAPPKIANFPEPLRRVRNVEVMVMLRRGGAARLWRSARGSSVARALITAAVVARQRWEERRQSMGRPLDEVLPELDVEVVLLQEDGTLLASSRAFIEAAFHKEHGVAYERRGAWRYTLPGRSDPDESPYEAYRKLLEEHGQDIDALRSPDLRLYRLSTTPIALSSAAGLSVPTSSPLSGD